MEKYSIEWKKAHALGWVQYHPEKKIWKRHFISSDTEYSIGDFFTKAEAEDEVKLYMAASEMGHKGGSAKSDRKTASSRENGRKGGRPKKVNKCDSSS